MQKLLQLEPFTPFVKELMNMDIKSRSLPNPIPLVKGLNHGSRMLRHESDQQLQHIHEIVVLRNMKEGD